MKELLDELDEKQAILIAMESEGGQILIKKLNSDIDVLINKLIRDYEVVEHTVLIAVIASIEAKKSLLDDLLRSKKQVKTLKEETKQYVQNVQKEKNS